MILQRQRPGLLDQELIDRDILATLLAHTALLDASEWRLGGRLVAGVLGGNIVRKKCRIVET